MAKDFNTILSEAQQIKNEIIEGANTALRIGTCLEDMVQRAEYDEANKVDMVYGKGLSTNDYTTTEKNKLAGIAANANNYVHPATHSADILTNGTTNKVYTATEQTKLAGIATGAEVNVQPDWNAVSGDALILNKPTTINGYGITDAYTKTEVDTKLSSVYKYKGIVPTSADLPSTGMVLGDVWNVTDTNINYAWDGSVWDPLGGTVGADVSLATPTTDGLLSATDFVKLSGIEANANYYVHPTTHSADIIVDGTTNKVYTATERTKLSGIAAGAEVNVNPDWNAVSGDAQILNKPTTISGYGITDAYTKTQVDTSLSGKESTITAGTTAQYWRGDKSWQTLNKAAVGLSLVENTALSTWAGSTNISTVGTITNGTWSAGPIAYSKGGTGLTTIGTAGQYLAVNSGATALEWATSRDKGVNTVTTLASLPITKRLVTATVTTATTISLASALGVGDELHIVVYNSSASAITQALPNTGSYISLSGTSISIPAKGRVEINILCYATTTYLIRAL